jgi:IPT/TIG domain
MASGLGTPRVTNTDGQPGLAAQLCSLASAAGSTPIPSVSGLQQTAGTTSIAGGGTLQIAGTNFGSTAGKVFFGAVPATVAAWTSTLVTVTIPAYAAPPGTTPGVGGSADVEVVFGRERPAVERPHRRRRLPLHGEQLR